MRFAIPILLVLLSASAFADELSFDVSGVQQKFARDASHHLILSKDCAQTHACEAYKALGRATMSGTYPRHGANPGAVICASKLEGAVVFGQDAQGNQNSFCKFGDGSMVSCGSLLYRARKNDLKKIE